MSRSSWPPFRVLVLSVCLFKSLFYVMSLCKLLFCLVSFMFNLKGDVWCVRVGGFRWEGGFCLISERNGGVQTTDPVLGGLLLQIPNISCRIYKKCLTFSIKKEKTKVKWNIKNVGEKNWCCFFISLSILNCVFLGNWPVSRFFTHYIVSAFTVWAADWWQTCVLWDRFCHFLFFIHVCARQGFLWLRRSHFEHSVLEGQLVYCYLSEHGPHTHAEQGWDWMICAWDENAQ